MGSGITSGECSDQDTVNISQETVSEWTYSPLDVKMVTIFLPSIWCFGLITNFSFLFVLVRVPKMRSETNIYLGFLAVSDIIYLSSSASVHMWRYFVSPVLIHYPMDTTVECVVHFMARNASYFAGVALVTMVSYERYLALCHPIKHLDIRGKRRTYRIVAVCWLVGLLLGLSLLPSGAKTNWSCLQWPNSSDYDELPSAYSYCDAIGPWVSYYAIPLDNIPWFIAMVLNIYTYARIIRALNERKSLTEKHENKSQWRIRNQVAKMLMVNSVVFFVCQVPYSVVFLTDWVCLIARVPNPLFTALGEGAQLIARIPFYFNSSMNPLIYNAMSSHYRAAFRQAFRRKQPKRERPSCSVMSQQASHIDNQCSTTDTSVDDGTNTSRL